MINSPSQQDEIPMVVLEQIAPGFSDLAVNFRSAGSHVDGFYGNPNQNRVHQ
jgi:hypothetical protein